MHDDPRASPQPFRRATHAFSHLVLGDWRTMWSSRLRFEIVRGRRSRAAIGVSALEGALSIWRVIRASFTRCVGILAVVRPAAPPPVDDPAVWTSNEPMPLIDVTIYVPARLADDDRKRKGDGSPGTAVITKTRPQTKRPNLYRVLLLNDDYT